MTREEIMGMSAEELRLAIAKAEGFKYQQDAPKGHFCKMFGNHEGWWFDPTDNSWFCAKCMDHLIPDWPTSIADAWELEAQLTPKQQEKYAFLLFRITSGYEGESETIIRWGRGLYDDQYFGLIHASPEQRCRAWLMAQEAQP